MARDDQGDGGASFAIVIMFWMLIALIFFIVSSLRVNHRYTTICQVYQTSDSSYGIMTADSGRYHIDHTFSADKASQMYQQLKAKGPATYEIAYSKAWFSQPALRSATLLPAAEQRPDLCPSATQ